MKKTKYSPIKIAVCLHIEKVHRHVFDNQYQQSYKITWKDRPILFWYNFLTRLFPDFRPYLKYYKPVIIRAYKLRRLSIPEMCLTKAVWDLNTNRYSAYLWM